FLGTVAEVGPAQNLHAFLLSKPLAIVGCRGRASGAARRCGVAALPGGDRKAEGCDRLDDLVGAVEMRAVPAVGQLQQLRLRLQLGDPVELAHRPVLVVLALDREDRTANRGHFLLDRPRGECVRQPDLGPVAERSVDVVVIARELLAQPRHFVAACDRRNRIGADRLDEQVRRERDDGGVRIREGARVDQRDRGAVAVPDEDRPFDAEGAQQRRQHVHRFVVHEAHRARLGARVRAAVAEARIDDPRQARGGADAIGEVAEQRHAAEPLVQEDECRRLRGRLADRPVLQAPALDDDVKIMLVATAHHELYCRSYGTNTPSCMASAASGKPEDEHAFLEALGRRVRERRDEAHLTRKRLAELSGLSERYLAQLESGDGNISILLIRRVAEALGCPLEQLLADRSVDPEIAAAVELLRGLRPEQRHEAVALLQQRFGETSRERARRIALVGLRGAGKSTLGAQLAARLRAPFYELDQQIERELGASLGSIFSMYGQDTFREAEARVLDRLTRTNRRCVIATGGSLVLEPRTYELLRERCFTVWLRASPEDHMDRVIAQGDLRPIRGREHAMSELRAILKQRE